MAGDGLMKTREASRRKLADQPTASYEAVRPDLGRLRSGRVPAA